MKTKLLSILTLLLCVCSGAWGETTTVFDPSDEGWTASGVNLTSGTTTVGSATWYGGSSSAVDNGGTIEGVTWEKRLKFGGGSTFQSSKTFARVFDLSISGAGTIKVYFASGSSNKSRYCYISKAASSTNRDTSTAIGSAADGGTGSGSVLEVTADAAGSYYVWCAENIAIYGITFEAAATEAYTVTFNAGSNGTCSISSLTESAPGAGVTLPSVTANSGYAFDGWYTAATGGTKVGDAGATYKPTANVTVNAQYSEVSAPTISVDASATIVAKNEAVTLTATVSGSPAPTIQWYSNTSASNTDGTAIEGATSATYSPSTATPGTYYYYAVATNSEGNATSDVQTITVNASNSCELTNIKFSNGAYGAINSATYGDKTIAVPYMVGQSAPTVVTSSVVVSDGATFTVEGTTLTVTAEDGTTTKEFTITTEEITPLEVTEDSEVTFSDVPSWVFNLYGYSWADDKESNKKGLKFAKAVDDASNMRIALGNTRQYYFIGVAKKLTLTGSPCATRKVNVYVNGVLNQSNVDNTSIQVSLDESAPCMVMIESNQTSGDGGFSKYAVEAVSTTLNADGFATYSAGYDFTVSGATAYKMALDLTNNTLTGTAVDKVPAGEGVLLKGEANAKVTIAATSGASALTDNNLHGTTQADGTLATKGSNDYYVLSGDTFKKFTGDAFTANKAYFEVDGTTVQGRVFTMVFDDETTGIRSIDNGQLTMDKVYNLNGQCVAQPTKGLYIVNGKKVVVK